jgi:hypothetical protein
MAQAKQVDMLISGLTNSAGAPLSQGKVYFYATDGTTLKTVWVDSEKDTVSANPVILTVAGTAEIFADGTYTVKIADSDNVTIRTPENLTFTPSAAATDNEVDASDYGTATDENAISLAITSASGADRTIFLTPGNWDISDNLTIPSNINLKYIFGAYTTIAAGKTLTINGTIDAPFYNIFRGSGTVTYDNRNLITPSIWGIGGAHDNLSLDGQILFIDNIIINGGSSTLPILIQKNEDGASTSLMRYDRTSASPADNDYYDIDYYAENDNNQQAPFARLRIKQLDVSDGTEKGQVIWSVADGADGSIDDVLTLDKTGATVTGGLVVSGDLTVGGTTTTVNSTVVTIDDPILTLGGDTAPGSDDNKDRGVEFRWHNGSAAKIGFFGFDDSTGKFTFIPDASNSSEVFSGTAGTVVATTFEGNLTGTINTAAQANITSLGTLSTLTVDNVIINGTTIGHTSDTDLITLTDQTVTVAGTVSATTLTGTLSTTAQTNVTSLGTLSTLTVDNVIINGTTIGHTSDTDLITLTDQTVTVAGTVSATTLTGTLSTAAQANITSLGTLSSVTVSGVSSFSDGSAAAPSITNTGDTNTGILFPAADTVAISVGGSEAVRVDSDGNVGIGESSPRTKLDILSTATTSTVGDSGAIYNVENYDLLKLGHQSGEGENWASGLKLMANKGGGSSGTRLYHIGDDSQTSFNISVNGGTPDVVVNSAGNVGIGTSSPDTRLHIKNNSFGSVVESITLENNLGSTNEGSVIRFLCGSATNGVTLVGQRDGSGGGAFIFKTSSTYSADPTEKMRIDDAGKVYMPSLGTSGTDNGTLKYNSSTGEIWVD